MNSALWLLLFRGAVEGSSVTIPGEARTTYLARLTTSAPHIAAITTTTARTALIPGGIETATIATS